MDETLKIKIKAVTQDAKSQIDSLKKSLGGLETASESTGTSFEGLGAKAGVLAATIIAVKSAIALCKSAIATAKLGDEIKDEAQKVHMSTAQYQEWSYVLKQNSVDMSTLKTSMKTFSSLVSSNNAALKKYGVTSTNVGDAFKQAVYSIQNMNSETEKIAALTELFGTRASELMPVLNMTNGETETLINNYYALGGVMSNELIAMSDQLTDNITAMKSAWQGLANTLGQLVIPIINQVVTWLTKAIVAINTFLSRVFKLQKTFGGSSEVQDYADAVTNVGGAVSGLQKTIFGFDQINKLNGSSGGTGTGTLTNAILGGFDSAMASAKSGFDSIIDKANKFADKVVDFTTTLPAGIQMGIDASNELSFSFKSAWEWLTKVKEEAFASAEAIKSVSVLGSGLGSASTLTEYVNSKTGANTYAEQRQNSSNLTKVSIELLDSANLVKNITTSNVKTSVTTNRAVLVGGYGR